MTQNISNTEWKRKLQKGTETEDSAPPDAPASAPDLTPSPASSFFKSPTAPAGKVLGRPQPPAKMIRK